MLRPKISVPLDDKTRAAARFEQARARAPESSLAGRRAAPRFRAGPRAERDVPAPPDPPTPRFRNGGRTPMDRPSDGRHAGRTLPKLRRSVRTSIFCTRLAFNRTSSIELGGQALHLHEPIADRALAHERERAGGGAPERYNPTIYAGSEAAVERNLFAAELLPSGERREIQIRIANWLLELEHLVSRKEDPGHMRFLGRNLIRPVGIRCGIAEKAHLLGERRLFTCDQARTLRPIGGGAKHHADSKGGWPEQHIDPRQ